jgi:hypothetical protein
MFLLDYFSYLFSNGNSVSYYSPGLNREADYPGNLVIKSFFNLEKIT